MKKIQNHQKVLAEKLRLAREDAGLTQSKAARLLKKPQWFISRCESGQRKIDVVELLAFAEVYRIDLSSLFKELQQ